MGALMLNVNDTLGSRRLDKQLVWPDWSKEILVLYWETAWVQYVHIQCKKGAMSIQNVCSELITVYLKNIKKLEQILLHFGFIFDDEKFIQV